MIGGRTSDQNRMAKKSHNVWEAIFKACDGDETKWMGFSPYFTPTGTHPLLLINIAETNYLLPPSDSVLSTTNFIAKCAITLQKQRNQLSKLKSQVYVARIQAAITF
jgi:hypothetical protein